MGINTMKTDTAIRRAVKIQQEIDSRKEQIQIMEHQLPILKREIEELMEKRDEFDALIIEDGVRMTLCDDYIVHVVEHENSDEVIITRPMNLGPARK